MSDEASQPWVPLSLRSSAASARPLHEGVPEHLDRPLRRWVERCLGSSDIDDLLLELEWPGRDHTDTSNELIQQIAWTTTAGDVLDVVDWILHRGLTRLEALKKENPDGFNSKGRPINNGGFLAVKSMLASNRYDPTQIASRLNLELDSLDSLLLGGSSAYVVNRRLHRLDRRVSASAAEQMERLTAPNPDGHLRQALDAAYGRRPDAGKAYDEAIRAVEEVAVPLVLPNAQTATLGKVLSHLEQGESKWELAITGANGGDIEPAVGLVRLLWRGHVGRHAGTSSSRPQRPEEAAMAVTIAMVLVEWFGNGAVRRRSSPP